MRISSYSNVQIRLCSFLFLSCLRFATFTTLGQPIFLIRKYDSPKEVLLIPLPSLLTPTYIYIYVFLYTSPIDGTTFSTNHLKYT